MQKEAGKQGWMTMFGCNRQPDYYFLKCNNRRKRLSREFSGRGKISLKTANAVAPRGTRQRELSSHEEGETSNNLVLSCAT